MVKRANVESCSIKTELPIMLKTTFLLFLAPSVAANGNYDHSRQSGSSCDKPEPHAWCAALNLGYHNADVISTSLFFVGPLLCAGDVLRERPGVGGLELANKRCGGNSTLNNALIAKIVFIKSLREECESGKGVFGVDFPCRLRFSGCRFGHTDVGAAVPFKADAFDNSSNAKYDNDRYGGSRPCGGCGGQHVCGCVSRESAIEAAEDEAAPFLSWGTGLIAIPCVFSGGLFVLCFVPGSKEKWEKEEEERQREENYVVRINMLSTGWERSSWTGCNKLWLGGMSTGVELLKGGTS